MSALLARLLAPDELGAYFLVLSMVTVSSLVAQMGLHRAVVRFVAESLGVRKPGRARDAVRLVFRYGFVASIVVAAIFALVLGRWLALHLFDSQLMADAINWAALWLVMLVFQSLLAETFRGFHDIRLASILGGMIKGVLTTLFLGAVWFVWGKSNLQQVLLLSVVASSINALVGGVLLYRKTGSLGSEGQGQLREREIFQTAWPLMIFSLAFFLRNRTDLWILGALAPKEEVAIYGAASNLIVSVAMPLLIVNAVVPPLIAELYAQGKERRLERMLRGTALLAGVPAFLACLAFILLGKPILGIVYEDFYRQGALVLAILSVGRLAAVLAGSCQQVLMMTGYQIILMWITLVSGVLNVLLSLLLVGKYGMVGVATAGTISLILENILAVLAVRWKAGIWTHVGYGRYILQSVTERLQVAFASILARAH